MRPLIDLTGVRFTRLVAVERVPIGQHTYWRCRCDCGATVVVRMGGLKCGDNKSCGCLKIDRAVARFSTHGMAHTPEYASWQNAKERCYNPKKRQYEDWGGRGIRMCDRWRNDFAAFFADMGPQPDGSSLDRINNDGHYEPANCRWATRRQQHRNSRRNHMLTFRGATKPTCDWCDELGLPRGAVYHRLMRGWPIERALTEPVRRHRSA